MICTDCKFCVLHDTGYSNYTVEGTDADCLLDMNPDFPADSFYETAEQLDFANVCPRFKEGSGIHVDVDNEDGSLLNYTDDEEVKAILEKQIMWEVLND
jgi:hypothetical protein